jgi:hypothetical protein
MVALFATTLALSFLVLTTIYEWALAHNLAPAQ